MLKVIETLKATMAKGKVVEIKPEKDKKYGAVGRPFWAVLGRRPGAVLR